jgi:hypothetical protein
MSTMTPAEMIVKHVETWDMPSLFTKHPEIPKHLAERYDVVFPEMFTGEAYVEHKHAAGRHLEKMNTKDVRQVVLRLLIREALEVGKDVAEDAVAGVIA